MLSTSLVQGLEIVAIVSGMTIVLSPVLCWALSDRATATTQPSPNRQVV